MSESKELDPNKIFSEAKDSMVRNLKMVAITVLVLIPLTYHSLSRGNNWQIRALASHFITTIMVYLSVATYPAFDFKQLVSNVWRTWPLVLITALFTDLINNSYEFLGDEEMPIWFKLWAKLIIYRAAAVVRLSLVVTVVEDCYGITAIRRTLSLLRGDSNNVVSLFGILILALLNKLPYYLGWSCFGFSIVTAIVSADWGVEVTKLLCCLVYISLTTLASLFEHLVDTVFYYECKRSHEGIEDQSKEKVN